MGANSCKERVDVGPLIETVFELNYMLLFIHTVEVFFSWNPFATFATYVATVTVDIFLSNAMLELGGVVQCAIDNRIYGPGTSNRFVDFSGEYREWALIHVIYVIAADLVIETLLTLLLWPLDLIGLHFVN